MTKKEYLEVKVGDKIRLKLEHNRVVTIGDIGNSPWFKFNSAGEDGFMVGNIWYRYKDCEVVKK